MSEALSWGTFVQADMKTASRRQPEGRNFQPVEHDLGPRPNHASDSFYVASQADAAQGKLRENQRRSSPAVIVAYIRRRQITALLLDRHHGPCLTDEAECYFDTVVVHFALICGEKGFELAAEEWAKRYTPQLSKAYIAEAVEGARRARLFYMSEDIGRHLNVTLAEHERLRLTHITPNDLKPAEFARYRNQRNAARRKASRLKTGQTKRPRELSASQTQPWFAAGFKTRRTWERHGKPTPGEGA